MGDRDKLDILDRIDELERNVDLLVAVYNTLNTFGHITNDRLDELEKENP